MSSNTTPSAALTAAAVLKEETLAPLPGVTRGALHSAHDGKKILARKWPQSKWLGDADEMFAYFQRRESDYELEKDGWHRSFSATMALLKQAQMLLGKAAEKIEKQNGRISHLEGIATTDELTGLLNRRGFYDVFLRELDRTGRDQSEGGLLVLIDLDNFKAINDTHGHLAGDAALKLVAWTLQQDIRSMDVAARLGGDEFVLLFSGVDRAQALARAQKIAWSLNHLSLVWQGKEIAVRASVGLKEYRKGDHPEKIFSDADLTLYAQKRGKQKTDTEKKF